MSQKTFENAAGMHELDAKCREIEAAKDRAATK